MTKYAVMVNDEMFPDSLSDTRDMAESYLYDAVHAAQIGANVRVVKLVITNVGAPTKTKTPGK